MTKTTRAAAAVALTLLAGAAPPAAAGAVPTTCDMVGETTYYVDDLQVVADPLGGYPLLVKVTLDPRGPATSAADHVIFLIDRTDMRGPAGQAWITMLTSRLRDRRLGVQPKCKTGANAGSDGSMAAPFVIGALSFGALERRGAR